MTGDSRSIGRAELTNRTVLVTGGAGFIGSHLVDALLPENDVRILDDLSSGSQANVPENATLVEGDVRSEDTLATAMAGVDVVFHEAALVSVARSVAEPVESHRINADATVQLLERARDEDARVVLASSAAIYGHLESVPVTESAPKRPTSPYGVTKLAVDHYARLYNELYDLPTVALRYFNAYGPGQTAGDYSGVITTFFDQAENGDPITVEGDGEQTRDFVHVSDIVRANLLAATTDRVGEAFNVGTGTSTSIRELAATVRDVTRSDSEIVHVDAREGDIQHSCADISKAQTVLGYEPSIPLETGLESLRSGSTDHTYSGSGNG